MPKGETYRKIKSMLRESGLHTVCEEARCPNIAECFCRGTATFMILGDTCTRNCGYCNVKHGIPMKVNEEEPMRVAKSIKKLRLKYAVITSVTRDDLHDFGSGQFSRTIAEIKKTVPDCRIEVLIPDFKGNENALKEIIRARPDVINHNIEVVREIFPRARPLGDYDVSIKLLEKIKMINPEMKTKSGIMVGLGETNDEILRTLNDLRKANVDIVTIGQYLQPNKNCLPVERYYSPDEFRNLEKTGMETGFEKVVSGPLVRSSYHAGEYNA